MRILIFGDSITQGFFDGKGGWAARLAKEMHARSLKNLHGDWIEVFNLGVSGDTVENVLNRVESETETRRLKKDKIVIIVAVGINDALLKNNKAISDVYPFQEELEELADMISELSDACMFIGLSAVDEKRTNPYAYSSTGKQYLNNRINLYEDCIKQVCTEKKIPFVPLHDKFIAELNKKRSLLADGLHPNDAGHSLIYKIIAPKVETLLRRVV